MKVMVGKDDADVETVCLMSKSRYVFAHLVLPYKYRCLVPLYSTNATNFP